MCAGAVAAAAVVAHVGPGITAIGPVRRVLFSRLAGRGEAGHVALTFDDGPDPGCTPALLDLLAQWGVRATFFQLGSMAAAFPGLACEVAAAGHEIAVHGWEHRYLIAKNPRAVYTDLARARDTVAEITGQAPVYYRPPYGVLTSGALAAARRLGLCPLLWTCWGREWDRGATPASVHSTLLRSLGDGGTILLHDSEQQARPGSWRAVQDALPPFLAECGRRQLAVGTVSEANAGLTARA
jgi:peptidoglycan/xylan/chitin deacetylase (PgdA/CDA1 family)